MYVGQESWESVYKNDNKTCKEKEDGAQLSFEISNPVGNGYQFLGYFDIAVYDKPTFWYFFFLKFIRMNFLKKNNF